MNLPDCERLLIVKPSSLGDVVHTLPAVSAILRTAPHVAVDWLVNTEWAPLLGGLADRVNVIPFPRRELRGPLGLLRAKRWADRELRTHGYDAVIDFQGLLRSALLGRLARPRTMLGFAQAREGAALLYHETLDLPDWKQRHAVHRNLALAAATGADISEVAFPLPVGDPVPELQEPSAPPLLLHPFSRGIGKSLAPGEVVELCEALAPHPIWLVGSAPTAPEPAISCPGHVVDLRGKTSLTQLIGLIRHAAWTLSVDSGPMHLAAALSSKVLSIHTWSNPAMVGPWDPRAYVWRESYLGPVGELARDQFPERRDQRRAWALRDRLLSPAEITRIADFLNSQLSVAAAPTSP